MSSAPPWAQVGARPRRLVRAFRNQNPGRARNQGTRIGTQATKETEEVVGWRVLRKQGSQNCLEGGKV